MLRKGKRNLFLYLSNTKQFENLDDEVEIILFLKKIKINLNRKENTLCSRLDNQMGQPSQPIDKYLQWKVIKCFKTFAFHGILVLINNKFLVQARFYIPKSILNDLTNEID